jgi:hypothetical protein
MEIVTAVLRCVQHVRRTTQLLSPRLPRVECGGSFSGKIHAMVHGQAISKVISPAPIKAYYYFYYY